MQLMVPELKCPDFPVARMWLKYINKTSKGEVPLKAQVDLYHYSIRSVPFLNINPFFSGHHIHAVSTCCCASLPILLQKQCQAVVSAQLALNSIACLASKVAPPFVPTWYVCGHFTNSTCGSYYYALFHFHQGLHMVTGPPLLCLLPTLKKQTLQLEPLFRSICMRLTILQTGGNQPPQGQLLPGLTESPTSFLSTCSN